MGPRSQVGPKLAAGQQSEQGVTSGIYAHCGLSLRMGIYNREAICLVMQPLSTPSKSKSRSLGFLLAGTTFLFNALLARHPHILSQAARVPDIRKSTLKAAAKAAAAAAKAEAAGGDEGGGGGGVGEKKAPVVAANLTRLVSIKEPHYFDRVVMGSFNEYLSKFGTTDDSLRCGQEGCSKRGG